MEEEDEGEHGDNEGYRKGDGLDDEGGTQGAYKGGGGGVVQTQPPHTHDAGGVIYVSEWGAHRAHRANPHQVTWNRPVSDPPSDHRERGANQVIRANREGDGGGVCVLWVMG